MQKILFIALLFGSLPLFAAYMWVDENGQKYFSDKAPTQKNITNITTIQTPSISTISTREMSPDVLNFLKQKTTTKSGDRAKSVLMYSAEWCGVCKTAKRYFKKITFHLKKKTSTNLHRHSSNTISLAVKACL